MNMIKYITPHQKAFLEAKQKIVVWIGGRGTGKTTIAGVRNYLMAQEMPRSNGIMIGSTLTRLLTKELPPRTEFWKKKLGLIEVTKQQPQGHFIVGQKPPKYFTMPDRKPESWETVVSFVNGSIIELVSMRAIENARGGNYDWGEVTEGTTIRRDDFFRVLYPTVRGMAHRYKSHYYLSWCFTSNMPWDAAAMWLPDMSIEAKEKPSEIFYQESTIYDAEAIYGIEYIEQLKARINKINPLIWQVEYMNKRLDKVRNAFYSALNKIHFYNQAEDGYDPFYNPDEPLKLSFDFGKSFNSCTAWQSHDRLLACIKEFFVQGNQLIDDVVMHLLEFYALHSNRHCEIYGDATGNVIPYDENRTLFEYIQTVLQSNHFTTELKTQYKKNPEHLLKQQHINKLLREDDIRLPYVRINADACPYTIKSMKNSPLTEKFKKDKSSEKNTHITPELATHLSDTADYFLFEYTRPYFDDYTSSGIYLPTIQIYDRR